MAPWQQRVPVAWVHLPQLALRLPASRYCCFTTRKAIRLTQVLSIFVCLWALLAIIGYLYQAEQLYQIAHFTGIAPADIGGTFVLGLGLLAARVDSGTTSVIAARAHAGGLMARRLLFSSRGCSVSARLGERAWPAAGLLRRWFWNCALVLAIIVIFAIAIWRSTRKLSEVEKLRIAVELELRERRKDYGDKPA